MRFACCFALFLSLSLVVSSSASDRLQATSMTESSPPRLAAVSMVHPSQDTARQTIDSLAAACNDRNFVRFMSYFTPKQRGSISRKMEDSFIRHDPEMRINDVVLLSEEGDTMAVAVRYDWSPRLQPGGSKSFSSKVILKKIGEEWKVDSEQVKFCSQKGQSKTNSPSRSFDFGGVKVENWDPYRPGEDIDPNLEHLRGDIGIRPGAGCVRCANGRCEIR